jgi:hypothetical protein
MIEKSLGCRAHKIKPGPDSELTFYATDVNTVDGNVGHIMTQP